MMIKFLDLQKVTAKYADEIHEAVLHAIDSGWYLQGEENRRFEADYARYIGTKYAIGCANGLDALIWIWRAYIEMGVMEVGDEVIVPANTYIATILALTENGLKPILVEPTIETYGIDDSKIEEVITSRTKAICIVHLYGQCAYTEKIGMLCKKYNLKLVEDNAQAHGCLLNGKRTGAIGDAAGVMFTAGFTDSIPTSLNQPAATLPLSIFFQLSSPTPEVRERAYAAALLLTIIVLILSIVGRMITHRFSKNKIK